MSLTPTTLPRAQVVASSRRVGDFVFDAIVSESHASKLLVTENPIESGALVADHAVLEPKELTIRGIIVEHTSPELSNLYFVPGVRDSLDYLDNIIYSSSLATKSREALAKINQTIETFQPIVQTARALAPWLTGGQAQLLSSNALSNERISELHVRLLDIQKSGEFLQVQTGTHFYENMLITEVSVFQDKDASATVMLTLKEVIVVETRQITGVTSGNDGTESRQASGRASTQSAPLADKGRTQPVEEDNQSLLNKIKKVF